ncbi:MAG: hypothetical protein JST80_12890 [Bdellovibrionales bacterium]|nr:hypothetical protein [Bdellovibrionales bacterium]
MKRLLTLPFKIALPIAMALTVVAPSVAQAAACCGGGFASPTIIAGDQASQFTLSYGFNSVVVDNVDSEGYWRRWDEHQQVQSFRIEGATLLSDRWQAGLAIPMIQRTRTGDTHSGLGDVAATLGYEFLPDWDYNPIRPKGVGYFQITLPTGLSKYESETGALDTRGNGFWSVGLGALFTKTFSDIDAFTSVDVHRSFSKSVRTSSIAGQLQPGFGGNFSAGLGYNFTAFRIGGALTWVVEDPVKIVQPLGTIDGAVERYTTASLALSYMKSDEWAGTLSYLDQTWFGSPTNTSLGRGLTIQIQRRWLR